MDKEKQFKYLCSKIDEQIQNNKIVSDNIFEEFKKEYLKLKKIYANNRANMNFVKYNYFSRRVYQNTMNNNYKINISLASILAYLQMNISNTSVYIYKIKMMIEQFNIDNFNEADYFVGRLNSLIKYIIEEKILIKQDPLEVIYLLELRLKKFIDNVNINNKELNDLADNLVKKMIERFDTIQSYSRDKKANSVLAESIYKISKKQSIYMVKFLYFEKKEDYRKTVTDKLNKAIEIMVEYSNKSLKIIKKVFKDIEETDKIKLVVTLKEIDVYMAMYYKLLYLDKNTNAAWKKINEMKQFLVYKIFNQSVSISEDLMKNITEEWNLLQAFNKISLLRNEIEKLSNNSKTQWIKETLDSINLQFREIERLFRYEENKSSVTKLENIDDSFMGTLIEYLLHDLLNYIKNNEEKIKKKIDIEYENFINYLKQTETITLNDKIEDEMPDIDINIKNKTAVLIKNGRLKSDEWKTIKQELMLVSKSEKYMECYYLINFNKNIDNIVQIKESFIKYEKEYNIIIKVMDIKDFYSNLLNTLKEPKKKYNFSEEQLYKIFGY
ncbi:MAG: hypothetical protein ACLU07_07420 [Lachnospirales bacterium]